MNATGVPSSASPTKPGGATPMIVHTIGPTCNVRPTASGDPPNFACQYACVSTTTGAPTGTLSSRAVK